MAIKNYMINDKWLDIAKQNIVEVESTDGVIGSVKVNGEEYGGGGGGSSDFSTAEVTVVSNVDPLMLPLPAIWGGGGDIEYPAGLFISMPLYPDTYTVPLYKGRLEVWGGSDWTVNCTGNIEFSDSVFIITGDGTITIS